MKKKLLSFCFLPLAGFAQICNPTGNMMLFSNYDGGILNINVDVNIPNLKIGVLSYEGTTINLSGAFVNNVTAVYYAGYNGSNAHCGSVINTTINGAPGAASTSINFMPAGNLTNANGYGSMICAYSCSNTTNQGGCNTVDQVESFFQAQFGATLYAHYVQYGCWPASNTLSAGGTCCPTISLNATTSSTSPTCFNGCNGVADASAFGGTPPYTYLWSNGAFVNPATGLCPGTYDVIIGDNAGGSYTTSVTVTDTTQVVGTFVDTDVTTTCNGSSTVTATGGSPGYTYLWNDPLAQTTATASGLCVGAPCVTITDSQGCPNTICTSIISVAGLEDYSLTQKEVVKIIDLTGRETNFKTNTVLIYIYSDGTHLRIMEIE